MKKIVLLLTILAICSVLFFKLGPRSVTDEDDLAFNNLEPGIGPSVDESEIQAQINLGLEGSLLDLSDVQAYTPKDVMKKGGEKKKVLKKYYAVKNYKPRASTLGFSIVPPPGANWFEKLEGDSLYYVKINSAHKRYAILTEAREVQLDEKMSNSLDVESYVKSRMESLLASSRYKNSNLSLQAKESPSDRCIRYNQYYQDHGMKGLRPDSYVNVDTHGLFCPHPENETVAIDINYVEKSLSNAQVKSFSNEGEQFLSSLKFH